MKKYRRFIPIAIIITLMAAVYVSGLDNFLKIETIKDYRHEILTYVDQHPYAAPLTFIIIYIIVVALSIPGAIFLTLSAGFIFEQPFSTIYAVIGSTIGAVAIFMATRSALGDSLKKRAGPKLKKMKNGFNDDAISYLLFLRMIPIFPFWLINIAPAVFDVSLKVFFWTTFLGVIPGTFVFTQTGTGIGAILESEEPLSVQALFNTDVKIALAALGVFILVPTFIKKYIKKSRKQ
ncbi:MAG: TVP38/TMEM64 family protein [Chlamydiota bacterium]